MPEYTPPSQQALDWVLEQSVGTRIVRIERLFGGITADMDRIVVDDPDGRIDEVVLRRWAPSGPVDDLAAQVDQEAAALQAVQHHRIPGPHLVAVDRTGERAGAPAVLMTAVPGQVELAPRDLDGWVERLADTLVEIHAAPPTLTTPSRGWFDPDHDRDWIADSGLRRDALQIADGDLDGLPTVLTHGDYQHFNVLWQDGRVSGVVDWTMAGIGPRGVDVGHCRLNLAVLFSSGAARTFLDRYQSRSGEVVDAVGDLRGLLQWSPHWQEFIPIQVNGRASVDLAGMQQRVVDTIKETVTRVSL